MFDLFAVVQLFKDIAGQLHAEIVIHLLGRAVVAQHAAHAQKGDAVAEVHVGHVVRDHQHGAVFVAELAAQLHHAAVQIGRKAACRLVQHKQARAGQQLHRNGDALFLPAGKARDHRFFASLQVDGGNGVRHGRAQLAAGGVVRDAQARRAQQALLHGEVLVQDVFLRHIANDGVEGVAVAVGVDAVKTDAARRAGGRAGDAGEQARFARAGPAHKHDKAVGFDLHRDAVHDVERFAGVAVLDRLAHVDELHADADLVLVVMQHPARVGEHLRRHVDDGALRQHGAAHAVAVEIGAVGGAEVFDFGVAVLERDLAVVAGDTVAGKLNVAVLAAADQHPALAAQVDLAQDGVVLVLLAQAARFGVGADLLHAEGDLLRGVVAVGVQADHVAFLQAAALAGAQVTVVVPGGGPAAVVAQLPAFPVIFQRKLAVADVIAAQHIIAARPAPEAAGGLGGRQQDALAVALFGHDQNDLTGQNASLPFRQGPYQRNSPQNGTNRSDALPSASVSPAASGCGTSRRWPFW